MSPGIAARRGLRQRDLSLALCITSEAFRRVLDQRQCSAWLSAAVPRTSEASSASRWFHRVCSQHSVFCYFAVTSWIGGALIPNTAPYHLNTPLFFAPALRSVLLLLRGFPESSWPLVSAGTQSPTLQVLGERGLPHRGSRAVRSRALASACPSRVSARSSGGKCDWRRVCCAPDFERMLCTCCTRPSL